MAKLIVYMRFTKDGLTYSGNFIYRCKTMGQCCFCWTDEIDEFTQSGWELEEYDIKEGQNVGTDVVKSKTGRKRKR